MGENLSYDFDQKILHDRKIVKNKLSSKLFWFMLHGSDWK